MNHLTPTIPTRRSAPGIAPAPGKIRRGHFRGDRFRGGFTLMELMIAMAVASLMLFLINYIFNDTTRAVSQGMFLSDIIGNNRAASEQFAEDAKNMIGPEEDTDAGQPANETGGMLVIVNYMLTSDIQRGPQSHIVWRGPGQTDGPVRSDQLMFFRSRGGSALKPYPITPEFNTTFGNTFRQNPADSTTEYACDYLKVWYGHAQLTAATGLDDGTLGNAGANAYANQWVLARQAMFLVDTTVWSFAGRIHAATAAADALVSNDTTPPFTARAYHGTTDMADQVLGATSRTNSILDAITGGSVGVAKSVYQTGVMPFLYLTERLRANASPQFDPSVAQYAYASWQVAQMHPVFQPNVGDFIVDFAADVSPLDGKVDTVNHDGDASTPEVIRWYSYWFNDPTGAPLTGRRDPNNPTGPEIPYDASFPSVYDIPASAFKTEVMTENWPVTDNWNAMFVFRHDDEAGALTGAATPQPSFWPYLLRIRYRVHDPRGQLMSGNGQHGMWFEQILKVNRPAATP